MTGTTASSLEDHRYCSVPQAAALLGVSRVSVWRWIRDGHLPATRLGPRITRINRLDLEHMLVQIQTRQAAASRDVAGAANTTELRAPEHDVQFYETDAFLLDAVTEFIGAALSSGDAGIVIATKPHRNGLADRLRASGLDVAEAVARGHYTSLDAAETLSRFMIDGSPDAERFTRTMGSIIARAALGGRRVRVFGEMVALLAADGQYANAVRLEELWNDLQRTGRFSLLCAYPIGGLDANVIGDVCASHSHVIPAESYSMLPTEQERLQAIVALQQKSRLLQTRIDERERTAAELRMALAAEQDAHQEALASQRKRDELVSVAAQELKHPMYSLSLQAQHALLRLGRETRLPPERVEKAVEAVTGQPAEISRLIGQMVAFSRIETGKLTLAPRWVDLTSQVEHVVAEMRARSTRHTITLKTPGACEAWLDPVRAEQVLNNLLDNAIRYSPEGGTVEVTLTHTPSTGATLTVWDRGQGIPPAQRDALFEHDEVGDSDACPEQEHGQEQGGGLGLGLFISRQIVELHGGELYAEFPPAGGTRIVMRLPVGLDNPLAQVAAD